MFICGGFIGRFPYITIWLSGTLTLNRKVVLNFDVPLGWVFSFMICVYTIIIIGVQIVMH